MRTIGSVGNPWNSCAVVGIVIVTMIAIAKISEPSSRVPIKVAFIGNSMQYYNDLPRFMEALSDGQISQNSCLHGNADFSSMLVSGNGMYKIWKSSGTARINDYKNLHDFGACTGM